MHTNSILIRKPFETQIKWSGNFLPNLSLCTLHSVSFCRFFYGFLMEECSFGIKPRRSKLHRLDWNHWKASLKPGKQVRFDLLTLKLTQLRYSRAERLEREIFTDFFSFKNFFDRFLVDFYSFRTSQNAIKMQSKFSQNAVKLQPKCHQNSVKTQSKFSHF